MKKKALLSSVLAIALCLCLIAGGTFALFTSSTEVNIAVQAGEVDVQASITELTLWSVEPANDGDPDTVADERGYLYTYEEQQSTFLNGGTAILSGSLLSLDRITPGDKVTFKVSTENNSNVAILYRVTVQCTDGHPLMSGLVVSVGNNSYEALESYKSSWVKLDPKAPISDVDIAIELPVNAGNEYQGESTKINILVEAIQGNAVVEGVETVSYLTVDTMDGLEKLLTSDIPYVKLSADITDKLTLGDLSNKIIDANGHSISMDLTGTLENVTISGVKGSDAMIEITDTAVLNNVTFKDLELSEYNGPSSYAGAVNIRAGADVDIVFENCSFAPNSGYAGVRVYEPTAELSFINCDFSGGRYAVYDSGAPIAKAEFINCSFSGQSSWAVQFNGSGTNSVITIDGCTFEGVNGGIIKVLGAPIAGSTFTFTNNVILNSRGHDGKEAEWFTISSVYSITASDNVLNGAAWNPGTEQGLGK